MSLPSPSLIVPTFSQYPSLQFQGANGTVLLGPAPFYLRGDPGSLGVEGLADMPSVVTGDTEAPRIHGQYVGFDKLSGRQPVVTLDVGPPFGSYGSLQGAMAALGNALSPAPGGVTEGAMFVQLSSGSPQLALSARPRKRTTLVDRVYANPTSGGMARNIPIQWWASDPTLYAAGTISATVGVATPLGGLSINPLVFPLNFGGGTEYNQITATNYGDLPCYPLATFTGPLTTPKLTNSSLSGLPAIQFNVALNAGDTLVVNFDPKYPSAMYTAAGSSVAASRLYTLSQGSQWWAVVPGVNNIQFTTADSTSVAGTCTLEYSSAYSAAS